VSGSAGLLEWDEAIGAAVQRALADGQLSVPVDLALPLDQVNEAFDRIRQRQVRGKIVIVP
jgi:NADPH:quinone reductase-like Zn-dependent oxidoreductase